MGAAVDAEFLLCFVISGRSKTASMFVLRIWQNVVAMACFETGADPDFTLIVTLALYCCCYFWISGRPMTACSCCRTSRILLLRFSIDTGADPNFTLTIGNLQNAFVMRVFNIEQIQTSLCQCGTGKMLLQCFACVVVYIDRSRSRLLADLWNW